MAVILKDIPAPADNSLNHFGLQCQLNKWLHFLSPVPVRVPVSRLNVLAEYFVTNISGKAAFVVHCNENCMSPSKTSTCFSCMKVTTKDQMSCSVVATSPAVLTSPQLSVFLVEATHWEVTSSHQSGLLASCLELDMSRRLCCSVTRHVPHLPSPSLAS